MSLSKQFLMGTLRATLGLVAMLACLMGRPGSAIAADTVPAALQGWDSWVLKGHETHRCPWLSSGSADDAERVCAWPSVLELSVAATGGHFSQHWQLGAESWIGLPGRSEQWPEHLTVDGGAAVAVERDGRPALRLSAGSHVVSGEFHWSNRPEVLAVPDDTGLIALVVNGAPVPSVQRGEDGVFLGRRASSRQEDQLELHVFRRLADEQPARLTTQIEVLVAGETREIRLPGILPEGYAPISLSSELTARLDPDNALRLQLRPGRYVVSLEAHGTGAVSRIHRPKNELPWPAQEVWSFAAVDRLRVAAVEGLPGVDPAVAGVPAEWRTLPAFMFAADATLSVAERSRGLAPSEGNDLVLSRLVWLDFSGDGYTVVDSLGGTMRHGWRLDLAAPYVLQSARAGDVPLLVTTTATSGRSGIEVRTPDLELTTVARVPRAMTLPATGWQERYAHVSGQLILPPAYRLLAVFGADLAPGAWIERWHLIDIFLVLLAAVTAWRVVGMRQTGLVLAVLVLTHFEEGAPTWLWLNLLVALALVRASPEGRLRRVARGYQVVSLGVIALALVPYAVTQVRYAVYPQLEAVSNDGHSLDVGYMERAKPAPVQYDRPSSAAVPARSQAQAELRRKVSEPPAVTAMTIAPAAAPAPPASLSTAATQDTVSSPLVEPPVPAERSIGDYEPDVLTQAGPGVPTWSYHAYTYGWNGPVEPAETVRFVLSPPWLTRLWRIAGTVLSVLLLIGLMPPLAPAWRQLRERAAPVAGAVFLLGALAVAPAPARANDIPPPALLDEYAKRLLEPPACLPSCVDAESARVELANGRLTVALEVGVLDPLGLALPSADPNWVPDRVEVDGAAAAGTYRDQEGSRYVSLARGHHVVRLGGPVGDAVGLALAFPVRPHRIDVSAPGWDVAGVTDRRLLSGTLELVRQRVASGAGAAAISGAQFPPFVAVERSVRLAHEWSVATTVRRVAPQTGAFTVKIRLLKGELLQTSDLKVTEGVVDLGFAADEQVRTLSSALPVTPSLQLTAAAESGSTEVWHFLVGPSWHAEFAGLPALQPADAPGNAWSFDFAPRPGETLTLSVSRPLASNGATLAYDRVDLTDFIGARSRESVLELHYRSTQGGRESVTIPPATHVTQLTVDGAPVALRPENGILSLPVVPGQHRVEIRFESAAGVSTYLATSPLQLHSPASDLTGSLVLPPDRWILYATGQGIGPAVLYWGELLLFLVVAVVVGRSGLTPLSMRDWLLLGLGLSTFSWSVLVLFALFIVVYQWRSRAGGLQDDARRYNQRQVALAVLAVVAIIGLVAAVPRGLLSQPDMRIENRGQASAGLHWFYDQASGAMPRSGVITVSLWWYKLAMLAWALWLSLALTRWIRWAWEIFRRDGLWLPDRHPPAPVVAGKPADDSPLE